jgi:hypothetical protein
MKITDDRRIAHGQVAFNLHSKNLSLSITEKGAHMAPVTFFTDTMKPIQPYYISPWQEEDKIQFDSLPPALEPLRGDFFCMPFGANTQRVENALEGTIEQHPPHGEVSGSCWKKTGEFVSSGMNWLELSIETAVRTGNISARWELTGQDNCIYSRHTITGMDGPMPIGHHATLSVKNGFLKLKSSPLNYGMTNPYRPPYYQNKEYYALAPGCRFEKLSAVPTIWKDPSETDCTFFPAREGFVDVVQLFQKNEGKPGWMTALCRESGYLWFSLKNLQYLPSTLVWMENHGRHTIPWNGRNVCIGLEDVCSYFAEGIAPSIEKNILNNDGIPTALILNRKEPTVISYIQGLALVEDSFDEVDRIEFKTGGIDIIACSGAVVHSKVQWDYLSGSDLVVNY